VAWPSASPEDLCLQGTQPVSGTLHQNPDPGIHISPAGQVARTAAFTLVWVKDLLKAAQLFESNSDLRLRIAPPLT
jgi:hypothetical protein